MNAAIIAALAPHAALVTNLVRLDGRDLTARQMATLYELYLNPGEHSVSSMAKHLRIARPGVSRIMDRLCAAGLADRGHDKADRRRVLLLRNAAGTEFMEQLARLARAPIERSGA